MVCLPYIYSRRRYKEHSTFWCCLRDGKEISFQEGNYVGGIRNANAVPRGIYEVT